MTQRIRRISVRESDGEQYIDLPVQMHQREVTYPSVQGEIEQLEKQVQQWKYYHANNHLQQCYQIKEKYDKLLIKNRQLEKDERQKDLEIEELKKELDRKKEQFTQSQRKRKSQIDDISRAHKIQVQNLKQQLQKSQSKLILLQNSQRKNKRNTQRQLSKLKDELLDVNQQLSGLSGTKQLLDRCRGQNSILKKKIQEIQISKQIPIQKNYHLTSQIQNLNSQLKFKDDQIFKDKQIIHRLELNIKLQLEKNHILSSQLQHIKLQSESKIRKLVIETDRMKLFQTESINLQRQLTKLNHIIRTKNQEIDILFHKIDTSRKPSARTNSGDEEYYNEFNKLQQQISQKHLKHKKQKQTLEERYNQLYVQYQFKINEKNKMIDEKSLIIVSLEKELQTLKRNYGVTINNLEDANAQSLEIITVLKKDYEDNQINLGKFKVVTVRMEDEIKLLKRQKQELFNENRIIETRYSHVLQELQELQEYIRSHRFKENYQNPNRAEIQQLYEAKLSSKDQLIELLRLKLKNFEAKGPLEGMFRTGTTIYH